MVAGESLAASTPRTDAAWNLLRTISDPEIPVISICDLGIVREISTGEGERADIVITPTYSGCPAMRVIEDEIRDKLSAGGFKDIRIKTVLTPAWTTDWMTESGKAALASYGIAPPMHQAAKGGAAIVRFVNRRHPNPACPQCGSQDTERLSEFGSTACKALYRCLECREPFDYFKPI
jgi:ring-1,2-phenylacetyl-CoA epoxidase subunit PaaD